MSLNLNAQQPYHVPVPRGRYLPTNTRARIVTVLLIIGAVLSVLSTILSIVELAWPGELFGPDEDMSDPLTLAIALLAIGVGLLTVLVYIATVVFFLMWLYRAHENLSAFGVAKHQLQYSSGWAVGSFFIPLVSLVIPYRAIKELWRKSVPNSSPMFSDLSPPGFFPLWWGFWIVSNIADQLYFRLSWRENASTDVIETIGLVSGLLGMVAALLAIKVVGEIERQQAESSRQIPDLSSFAPPPGPPEFSTPGASSPVSGYNS